MANAILKQFSKRCYASQHLTLAESGLLDVCMRLTSGGKNALLFDGRKMAARFSGVSKDVMYRATASLVEKGWLIPINGNGKKRNKATGMYDASEYRVMSHDVWVESHGTKQCAGDEPVAPARMAPVAKSPTTSRKTGNHQSQNRLPPVAPARHSFVVPFVTPSINPLCDPAKSPESKFLNEGQENQSVSEVMCPASRTSANGLHSIPEYAEYDSREGWGARRDIGRGLTAAEVEELRRLNRERIKPQVIQ